MLHEADTAVGGVARKFPPTRHSLIFAAANGEAVVAREALGAIIDVYWKPAYKYIRLRWNRRNEETKDLVQGFFAALIEGDILAKFDGSRSSFRTYLRACLDKFVMKQDESANRLKRGGSVAEIGVDFETAELEIALMNPGAAQGSMEEIFYREWQRQIFALAIADLWTLYEESGKSLHFRIFTAYDLADEVRPRYEDLSAEYGIPVTSITNYLAGARRELRRLVLERLGSITSSPGEQRAETRELFG